MFPWVWVALGVLAGGGLASFALAPWVRRKRRAAAIAQARRLFRQQREWLEARFVKAAAQRGLPRGLDWANCDFDDAYAVARDRATGQLRALVGVTIRLAAIEGGGLEHTPAAGGLRAATAVFQFDGRQWRTDGRVVFNLSPAQTIRRFQHELEPVE